MKKLKTYKQFNEGLFFKDDNKKLLANLLTRLDIADHIDIKENGKEVIARIDAMADLKINWKSKIAEYAGKTIKLNDDAIKKIKEVLKKFETPETTQKKIESPELKGDADGDYEDLGFDSTFMLGGAQVKVPKKYIPKKCDHNYPRWQTEKGLECGGCGELLDKNKYKEKTKKCENCGKKVKASEIEKGLCHKCFYDIMY